MSEAKSFEWPELDSTTDHRVLDQLHTSISIYDRSGVIEQLELGLEGYLNRAHALLTNSGTSALHTAFVSADFGPGDEVIFPAYTFFATASPIFQTGATPIFADCDERGQIDVASVRSKISDKTRGIVVTHMWGIPADVVELRKVADEHNLKLIEDISHAFGATIQGTPVGTFGHSSAQSLQGQKVLTGGEGGVYYTDEKESFHRALLFGHYNKRCRNEIDPDDPLYAFATTGFGLKLRIHPLAAAIAIDQLDKLPQILTDRNTAARTLAKGISQIPGIAPVLPAEGDTSSWYAFVFKINDDLLHTVGRDEIVRRLHNAGLTDVDIPDSTRPLLDYPLFTNPGLAFRAYADFNPQTAADFPAAYKFYNAILKIPVWHGDNGREANRYVQVLHDNFAQLITERAANSSSSASGIFSN